jgi:hypothetical protein
MTSEDVDRPVPRGPLSNVGLPEELIAAIAPQESKINRR